MSTARLIPESKMPSSMIIRNVVVYDSHGRKLTHKNVFIDNGKISYLTQGDQIAHRKQEIPSYDAKEEFAIMPGMLDTHIHGQGGFDFGDTSKENGVKGAAIALGKSGLSYAMATLPTLNPGWCEFRIMTELPHFTKGACTENKNRNEAAYRVLPGKAKAAYILVNDKLFYIDKIKETITELPLQKNDLDNFKKNLQLDRLTVDTKSQVMDKADNSFYEAYSSPLSPFDNLTTTQLKIITDATHHTHALGELPCALRAIDQHVIESKPTPGVTNIVGVHLEGPFIAHNCKGAHDERVLQSEITYDMLMDIIREAPHITQWKLTIAPDLPGAIQFLQDLKTHKQTLEKQGISIKVNIGHSNASKSEIDQAIKEGVVGFTHLGNACQEKCCRKNTQKEFQRDMNITDSTSNIVQWVLENREKCPPGVELITDGSHLSADFVSLVKQTIGHEKILIITDALGATGLSDGYYMLGTLRIYKQGNIFYVAKDHEITESKNAPIFTTNPPTLAGGASSLAVCAEKYVEMAFSKENTLSKWDAIFTASVLNPRVSSLNKETIDALPDDQNFVMLNSQGQLILSCCNGNFVIQNIHQLTEFTQKKDSSDDNQPLTSQRRYGMNPMKDNEDLKYTGPFPEFTQIQFELLEELLVSKHLSRLDHPDIFKVLGDKTSNKVNVEYLIKQKIVTEDELSKIGITRGPGTGREKRHMERKESKDRLAQKAFFDEGEKKRRQSPEEIEAPSSKRSRHT